MSNILNISQLAQLTGVSRKVAAQRLEEAEVDFVEGKRNEKLFSAPTALRAILLPDGDGISYESERAALTKAKREAAEIQLAVTKGELQPIDEILEQVEREYAFVRSKFKSIPAALAKHVAVEIDPQKCFQLIQDAIEDAFQSLQADQKEGPEELPVVSE